MDGVAQARSKMPSPQWETMPRHPAGAYSQRVRRVVLIVLALNALVSLAKIVAGLRANALSVVGDGLHSAIDAANNIVILVLVHAASRPPDDDHPYGHGKFETVGAFVLSGLLFLTAFELARAAAGRLVSPGAPPEVTPVLAGVVAVTLLVNVGVTLYERAMARRLGSDLLRADAAHTASDAWVSLSVLGGFLVVKAGYPIADAAIALAVSGVIAWSGYRIFAQTVPVLTDRIVFDPARVEGVVMGVPGVTNVHDIRSRGAPAEAFVQMHLVVDTRDVEHAHRITEEVERRLETELGAKEVLIHVEPYDDSDASNAPTAG